MTMRIYSSRDASAPTLQGVTGGAYSSGWTDGSLLQLLKAILVDGYGSKTAAGWSLAFHGTDEGVFQQGAGCELYLHVLDDGSATAGAREAIFNGGESYTAVGTGTGLFPSSGQNGGKLYFRKSDTADTTQRPWICFADNKTFYLFAYTGFATTAYYAGMAFGDYVSFYSGDQFNCIAIGRITSAATDTTVNEMLAHVGGIPGSVVPGHYCPRAYTQQGTSIALSKMGNTIISPSVSSPFYQPFAAGSGMASPNPPDGKIWLGRVYLTDNVTPPFPSLRGYLRGMWNPMHNGVDLPLEFTFNGMGSMSGRLFRVLGLQAGNSSAGRYVMETSDTWDS